MEKSQSLNNIKLVTNEREVLDQLQKRLNRQFIFYEWPENCFERVFFPENTILPILSYDTLPFYAENGHVEKLELNQTNIEVFPEEVCNLPLLRILSLYGNRITDLPSSIQNLNQLRALSLTKNNFTQVPEAITKINYFTHFSIAANHLNEFPDFLLSNKELIHLNLSSNKIPKIPKEIGELKKLESLILSANPLGSVPETIFTLFNLNSLELANTGIESVPDSLCHLGNLQNLNLTSNNLTQIPKDIGRLAKLRNVRLGKNKLQTVPESIGTLQHLVFLDLHSNQIVSIPESFKNLKSTSFIFDGNPLSNIPQYLPLVDKLQLLGNTIRRQYCDTSCGNMVGSGGVFHIIFLEKDKRIFQVDFSHIGDETLNICQSIIQEIMKIADNLILNNPGSSILSTPEFKRDCNQIVEQNKKIAKKNKFFIFLHD